MIIPLLQVRRGDRAKGFFQVWHCPFNAILDIAVSSFRAFRATYPGSKSYGPRGNYIEQRFDSLTPGR